MAQKMSQNMILAPRMIQSMEILQLPIMALQERILQELQENPVLELRDSSDEQQPAADEAEEVYDPTQSEVLEDTRDPAPANSSLMRTTPMNWISTDWKR